MSPFPASSLIPPPVEAGTGTDAGEGRADTARWLQLMSQLRARWKDCPDVTISYHNLSYTVPVPIAEHITIPSFVQTGWNGLVSFVRRLPLAARPTTVPLYVLAGCSGKMLAGEMSLVLAPPGHGKSSLLKALAGRLKHSPHISGDVLYNGLQASALQSQDVSLARLLAYVDQNEVHFPLLTVRETLDFAAQVSTASVASFGDTLLDSLDSRRVDLLLDMLGLRECASTPVGNESIPGVSGGERKRLSLGEMLAGNARVLFLDEVTTGLDSAVAFHILHALQQLCRTCGISVMAALLQPTPEMFALFDNVILLRDGHTVYSGSRTEIRPWFEHSLGVSIPTDRDEAGFLVEFLADPVRALDENKRSEGLRQRQEERRQEQAMEEGSPGSVKSAADSPPSFPAEDCSDPPFHWQNSADTACTAPPPALSTKELVLRWKSGAAYHRLSLELKNQTSNTPPPPPLLSSSCSLFSRRQLGCAHPRSWAEYVRLSMARQWKLSARNRQLVVVRLFQCVFMGLVYSTLLFQLRLADYDSKMGLFMYVLMFGCLANLTELSLTAEARSVVLKQLQADLYPPLPYVAAVSLLSLPLVVTETVIYGSFMYWVPALAPEPDRFFFFLLTLLAYSTSISTFFRAISHSTANPDVAGQLDFPFMVVGIISGGYLVPYTQFPRWLIWAFWISPVSWAFRSFAQNEFQAERYDDLVQGERVGTLYLSLYEISTDEAYKWAGIGYLFGFAIVFAGVSVFILSRTRDERAFGTSRTSQSQQPRQIDSESFPPVARPTSPSQFAAPAPPGDTAKESHSIQLWRSVDSDATSARPSSPTPSSVSSPPSSLRNSAMPFTPITLAWKDVHYWVPVPAAEGGKKELLKGVSGCCLPGTLTALMGSSGAGKTTLLDVLASRKTAGTMAGEVLINGRPKTAKAFFQLSAYCEQRDTHMGLVTVKEAVDFSARLRLPAVVSAAQRETWIGEVLELVGMAHLAHRLVGDVATPGLAAGQLKLLTIAVELVANPSVLFLDEPTSGLDAPTAARIMRAVRRVTDTGRSVLCTIHQPSSEVFFLFDRVLLLASGGEEVFFGSVSEDATSLVRHFETCSRLTPPPRLPLGQNPATWVLDLLDSSAFHSQQWPGVWLRSAQREKAITEIASACSVGLTSDTSAVSTAGVCEWQRYCEVQRRYWWMHWRNAPTNLSRILLLACLGLVLGLIYFRTDPSTLAGVISFESAVFLGISFPAAIAASSAFPSFFRQRAVYHREWTIGMYSSVSYSTAMALVEMFYIALALAFFVLPFYFLVGMALNVRLFFQLYLAVYLQALVYSFLSQLWMALFSSLAMASLLDGLSLALFFMFGGLYIKAANIGVGWKWFYLLDPIPKTFISALMPQLECTDGVTDAQPACPSVLTAEGPQTVYSFVSGQLEGTAADYWPMVGWLVMTLAIIRFLTLLALRFVSHLHR